MRPDLRLLAVSCAILVGTSASVATAQALRSGNLLVANQEAASASLIDLRTDSMRFIAVGIGPHEAMISPSGRTGVVTIYGQRPAGNELAVIDIASGTVTRTISLGQYTRPHGVEFIPGDEGRRGGHVGVHRQRRHREHRDRGHRGRHRDGGAGLAHGGHHRRRKARVHVERRVGQCHRDRPGGSEVRARHSRGAHRWRASR